MDEAEMTIDDVMRLAREAAHKRATEANWHGLRSALLALLDAEAEACAQIGEVLRWHDPLCSPPATYYDGLSAMQDAIRARIAARKGGNDD